MRLSCGECDTDDGDGITMIEAMGDGWTDIHEAPEDPKFPSAFHWYDHLGLCKQCSEEEGST